MPFAKKPSRTKPVKVKKGLTLYRRRKNDWKVDYPHDAWTGKYKRYGYGSLINLINLIYYLDRGYSIEKADKLAFRKTRRRKQ